MRVALVTDSTASLSDATVADRGVRVVPLEVVIGDTAHEEGSEAASPGRLAAALRGRRPVSTSRPGPETVLEVYEQLASEGHVAVVSVHISGELSGTVESARLAARRASVPVHLVDTRQVGMGTGYAVLAAADVLDGGGTAEEAAEVARARGEATTSLFYVDTLEHLRRGGRVGAAAALVGSALAVKPILRLTDGRVGDFEKVRTAGRALQRLETLAVEAAEAAGVPVDVAVAHLEAPERAQGLVSGLAGRLGEQLEGREVALVQIGAVLGAHVGPGMVAVVVAPRPPQAPR